MKAKYLASAATAFVFAATTAYARDAAVSQYTNYAYTVTATLIDGSVKTVLSYPLVTTIASTEADVGGVLAANVHDFGYVPCTADGSLKSVSARIGMQVDATQQLGNEVILHVWTGAIDRAAFTKDGKGCAMRDPILVGSAEAGTQLNVGEKAYFKFTNGWVVKVERSPNP